jgi:HD-GYP domain-containing protein (c-di-GMP phosphodiesterase class II)
VSAHPAPGGEGPPGRGDGATGEAPGGLRRFDPVRPRARILTSVLVLLVVVGALPLTLFGVRLTAFNRARLQDKEKELQLDKAESFAREVGEFVRAERVAVEGFARGLEAALVVGEPQAVVRAVGERDLLNRYLEADPGLLKLIYARPAEDGGQRLTFVSASRPGEPGALAGAEEYLVGVGLERGLAGDTVVDVPPGETPLLLVVVPVRRGQAVEGVLAALVSLDGLQERAVAPNLELYAVYVVDADGRRVLAHSRGRRQEPGLLETDLVAAFRDGGGTRMMPFRRTVDGERRDMIGAYATVAEVGWGVMVEIDQASAYYAVRKMQETTVLWSAASVLVALVLGSLFARRLVRPIRELADGALRLARGDFSRRIRLKSRNELGTLSEAFNHMAGEIEEQLRALEEAARENKELFLASIRMLAEAIDEKDPYTRGHSERVTRYAVATARACSLDEAAIEKVQIAALLHDVGKIGIDDAILRKPTALTDEEFEVMKQHPEKGAHIMSAVRQLTDILPGMRFHHERVDGTGYPLGLRGDAIPLAAQIISVADTFDAMTTDRPYQRGMDPEFVVGKLRGWVGSRFRADVVAAFERAFRDGQIELRPGRTRVAAPAGRP